MAFALLCVRGAEGRILPWCALSHSLARVFAFASNRRRACNAGHSSHTAHRTHAQEGPHHTTTPRCALFVRLRARSWAMPRWCALLNHHWHIKHREHKTRNPVPPAKSESTALGAASFAGRKRLQPQHTRREGRSNLCVLQKRSGSGHREVSTPPGTAPAVLPLLNASGRLPPVSSYPTVP